MPTQKLKDFLDSNGVKYIVMKHSEAYTAQEVAAAVHIDGKRIAKTVMVNLDGKMAMAVLPASYQINFEQLKEETKAQKAELSSEVEFKDRFPGCQTGAMPPFGNLYDMDVWVAATLVEDADILFNAGTHSELVKMAYNDFEALVRPKVIRFTVKAK